MFGVVRSKQPRETGAHPCTSLRETQRRVFTWVAESRRLSFVQGFARTLIMRYYAGDTIREQ